MLFLGKPKLHHIIEETGGVDKNTSWGSQIFVLRYNPSTDSNVMSVYDANTYSQTYCIKIPGSKYIYVIALCAHNKFLYLSDPEL